MTEAQRARASMRDGRWQGPTVYKVPGFVQTNLVVLSQDEVYEFLVYCQRNPKPCPVLEVTDPGDFEPRQSAPGADLRSDLPRYRIFRDGEQAGDVADITDLWTDQSVAFLIGSSLSFDDALLRAGVPLDRVWVLNSNVQTVPSGKYKGPLVVTMRWMTSEQAVIATQLTSRYPFNHGAPVHIGAPEMIGADMENPIFGNPVEKIPDGVTPVFWACGVTPQEAALRAKPTLMITHSPGHAFITDLRSDQICIP